MEQLLAFITQVVEAVVAGLPQAWTNLTGNLTENLTGQLQVGSAKCKPTECVDGVCVCKQHGPGA